MRLPYFLVHRYFEENPSILPKKLLCLAGKYRGVPGKFTEGSQGHSLSELIGRLTLYLKYNNVEISEMRRHWHELAPDRSFVIE